MYRKRDFDSLRSYIFYFESFAFYMLQLAKDIDIDSNILVRYFSTILYMSLKFITQVYQ